MPFYSPHRTRLSQAPVISGLPQMCLLSFLSPGLSFSSINSYTQVPWGLVPMSFGHY